MMNRYLPADRDWRQREGVTAYLTTSCCSQPLSLIHIYGEAGQVVLVHGIEAGHLSGLAAHQGALGLAAALGDAGDDVRNAAGVVLAAGDVVQEEQGGGPAAEDVYKRQPLTSP